MCRNIIEIAFSYTNRLRLGQAKGGLVFKVSPSLRAERSNLVSDGDCFGISTLSRLNPPLDWSSIGIAKQGLKKSKAPREHQLSQTQIAKKTQPLL